MIRDRSAARNQLPRSPARRPWRLIHGYGCGLDPVDGATNMAMDAALLESVKAGAPPVLRLYRWSPACLSFGRNQPARDRYDRAAAASRGIDFVRRPTGGQAVLHDDELTYAVIAPVAGIGKPRAAYRAINEALLEGLSGLGLAAGLAGQSRATDPGGRSDPGEPRLGAGPASSASGATRDPDWDAACFRRPERGEVVVGGAKLVGSAQRMEGRTILQHGSILLGGSQAAAEDLLISGSSSTSTPSAGGAHGRSQAAGVGSAPDVGSVVTATGGWTTLEREMGWRPSAPELADAVASGFAAVLGVALEPAVLSTAEREAADRVRSDFTSDAWTWRR